MWGEWTFVFDGIKLCGLRFQGGKTASSLKACAYAEPEAEGKVRGRNAQVYQQARRELNLYLAGKIKKFTIPVKIYGTEFQTKVLEATRNIPYGETRTYGEIACAIGRPTAARAVGAAAGRNPIWVAIPCHRCVGKDGALTGYAGGLWRKEKLLALEKKPFNR